MKRPWFFVLLLAFCLGASCRFAPPAPGASQEAQAPASRIPAQALQALAHIRATGQPPPGCEGGRRFGNYGDDGGQKLPETDARGGRIHYQEWDIHPKVPGRNRGAERLVTGSDGRAWFTSDHYRTFTEVP